MPKSDSDSDSSTSSTDSKDKRAIKDYDSDDVRGFSGSSSSDSSSDDDEVSDVPTSEDDDDDDDDVNMSDDDDKKKVINAKKKKPESSDSDSESKQVAKKKKTNTVYSDDEEANPNKKNKDKVSKITEVSEKKVRRTSISDDDAVMTTITLPENGSKKRKHDQGDLELSLANFKPNDNSNNNIINNNPSDRPSYGLAPINSFILSKVINEEKNNNNNNNHNNNNFINNNPIINTIRTTIPQQRIVSSNNELSCGSYLFPFTKQYNTNNRKYEYTKASPINKNIIDYITKDWIVCIDPIGSNAVVAFTKTNTFIVIMNDSKKIADQSLVFPSVLKNGDSVEFIALGKWIREESSEIFYPSDLYTYDQRELSKVTNTKEWDLPNDLINPRLRKSMKERYQMLHTAVQNSIKLEPVPIPDSNNSSFEVRMKTLGQLKEGSTLQDKIILELSTIKNNGVLFINPNHLLNERFQGQYLLKQESFVTVDVLILPSTKPISGVDEGEWRPSMIDNNNHPIFPLFTKIFNKKYTNVSASSSSCLEQHISESIGYMTRGYVQDTIAGIAVYKELMALFNAYHHDNTVPIVVTCIIPPHNNKTIEGWWIHRLKTIGSESDDLLKISRLLDSMRTELNFEETMNKLFI
jgi:hypothetical protein